MSDEHWVAIIQSVIWASALVISVLVALPVIRYGIQRSSALREMELRRRRT